MPDINETLAERGGTHGVFSESAVATQRMKEIMRQSPNWPQLSAAQQEALDMIQHKISRITYGDSTLLDSVRDIIGYAQLMYNEMGNTDGANDVHTKRIHRVNGAWVDKT